MHQVLHPVSDVLVATDFSPGAEAAADAALDYARALGSRLHLLHVAPGIRAGEAMAERLAQVAHRLEGVAAVSQVATGRPADRILQYAAAHGVGLIVLGRHGRTGFTPALLGTVAEEVSRRAGCPVVTVPCAEAAAAPAPAPARAAAAARSAKACLVCAAPSADLICEACRARIRGQALQQKWDQERARSEP
jgi:nucleotide-binding universal stress UspA family protein